MWFLNYIRDFFYYTRTKNPDALIMSRPVDSWEFVYHSFSPRDVVFAGWVGDQVLLSAPPLSYM